MEYDRRLLVGKGQYVADLSADGVLHGMFLRSPHAHARILDIDITAAVSAPGVVHVLTADDIRHVRPLTSPMPLPDDRGTLTRIERPILCDDRVRHVGDPIALVVAESESAAQHALELIAVEYESLAASSGLGHNRNLGVAMFESAPDNVALRWSAGDAVAVEQAFAAAAHIVSLQINQARVAPTPIEPRGVLACHDRDQDRLILEIPSQGAAFLRDALATSLARDPQSVRVITRDVGGSFGMKAYPYPEYVAVAVAATILGRPVRWIASRSESLQSDTQAREMTTMAELALDASGLICALRLRHEVDLGAYVSFNAPHTATHGLASAMTGLYAVPAACVDIVGRLTNTPWTDAYRGAGKPESVLVIERLMDEGARRIGIDAAEIRRRNLIPAAWLPFRAATGETFDSGDFQGRLERALELASWNDFRARRQESAQRGRLRGIGLSCWLDVTSAGPFDHAFLTMDERSGAVLTIGSQDTGQGHWRGFGALLMRDLGAGPMTIRQGDSDLQPDGGGTYGAKTMAVAGSATDAAAKDLLDTACALAADIFGVTAESIAKDKGDLFVPGTNHRISLVALAARHALTGRGRGGGTPTYPNGCHICEVEIDPETGDVKIVGYWAADDYGPILDYATLAGQIRGGIAQGIGQALHERVAFDPDCAQILTGSLMDYGIPRASVMPESVLALTEDHPCATNALGVKGAGQAGTIAALAAVMNAVNDAVTGIGGTPIDPPAVPLEVWRALASTRSGNDPNVDAAAR